MAGVYTKRFIAGHLTAGSFVATVPAGKVWIITNMDAVHLGTIEGSMGVTGATGLYLWFIDSAARNLNDPSFQWEGRQVLYAGEHLTITLGAGVFDVWVTGYELDA